MSKRQTKKSKITPSKFNTKETWDKLKPGDIVFVADGYPTGEFFIVRATRNIAYGVSTKGGYDSHELRSFQRLGKDDEKEVIVDVYEDQQMLTDLIEDLEEFAKGELEPKGELRWIESVYKEAGSNARLLKRVYAERYGFVKQSSKQRSITLKTSDLEVIVIDGVKFRRVK